MLSSSGSTRASTASCCGDCGGGACLATRDTIVIGIDNTPGRIWELTPTADASIGDGGGGDAYLTMVATELKPTVDAMLRTSPGPASLPMPPSAVPRMNWTHMAAAYQAMVAPVALQKLCGWRRAMSHSWKLVTSIIPCFLSA